ncbi:hypothetical protein [Paenibacillus sp. sgz302251]|uniref:hypothetical protein n=1 Tax=Paenibacillus sp. sgz302251 TaxID=3414493 RepID=UPI003C7A710A
MDAGTAQTDFLEVERSRGISVRAAATIKRQIWPRRWERGSGLTYSSVVRSERLLDSYQNEVARRVPEALQRGFFGWEVTDLKVTLVEGEHHVWHTHPLDQSKYILSMRKALAGS